MTMPFLRNNSSTIKRIVGDKVVHIFSSDISQNVNVITRLEFELAYCSVQYVKYYIAKTLPDPYEIK